MELKKVMVNPNMGKETQKSEKLMLGDMEKEEAEEVVEELRPSKG